MDKQNEQPPWAAAVEALSDFVIGSLKLVENKSKDFIAVINKQSEIDATSIGPEYKNLGPATMIIDKARYEGHLFGKNDFYRYSGRGEQGQPFMVRFTQDELVLDAGSYPWRVELKPRPGIWEKAILTDLTRNPG